MLDSDNISGLSSPAPSLDSFLEEIDVESLKEDSNNSIEDPDFVLSPNMHSNEYESSNSENENPNQRNYKVILMIDDTVNLKYLFIYI